MKTKLNAENLEIQTSDDGVVIEPSYCEWLRQHDYPIDSVDAVHVIRRSDSDTAHLVMRIKTLTQPVSDPETDAVADAYMLDVCDCWNWRTNSADLRKEPVTACGDCVHIREAFRAKNAAADDKQTRLNE